MSEKEAEKILLPGTKFYDRNKPCHVVAIIQEPKSIKEDGEKLIITKTWIRSKKRWSYDVKELYLFIIGFDYGLKLKK